MQKITSGMTLYEKVVEQIKTLIIQEVYKKGDFLPGELALAKEMGVSRITIREAFHLLNEAGIIETVHGKGSYVKIGREKLLQSESYIGYLHNFQESTKVRLLIEPVVAKEVAMCATEEEIIRIGNTLKDEYAEESFHRAVVAAAHMPLLLRWLDELFVMETDDDLSWMVLPVHQKTYGKCIKSQHKKIYEAIVQRDGEFAFFYMKEHLKYVQKVYTEFLELFLDSNHDSL